MTDVSSRSNILLVTVTEGESQAVLKVFKKGTGKDPFPLEISGHIYHDLGEVNGSRVFLMLSEMGSNGMGASQQAIQKGITALRPSFVILTGIAFGIDEHKQAIGDILVSKRLWLYESQRIGKEITPRGDKPHASSKLIDRFQNANLSWDGAKVHFGLVLTGEKLVDNKEYREKLKTFEPDAIGGEMEGAGLYVACQDDNVDWILVKAICDWADGNKSQDKESRQHLAADNAASFVFHALKLVSNSDALSAIPLEIVRNIPFVRNRNFTGRENKMIDLRNSLISKQLAVLVGLSGNGKTGIAIEYAYRYSYDYDVIWWINAERPDMIKNSYADLANSIHSTNMCLRGQSTTTFSLKRWMESNTRWLLILDNARDLTDLQEYLPQGGGGHIVITSINPNWLSLSIPINIDRFIRQESIEFLFKRTRQNNVDDADELATALADLPLALSQAGAYIEETALTLRDYLKLFNSRRNELWKDETPPQDYPNTVEITFSLSLDKIKDEFASAADLLNLIAFLAPEFINLTFLKNDLKCLPSSISDLIKDSFAMNRAIRVLRHYSLIKALNGILSIHLLVQTVIRDRLNDIDKKIWASAAIALVHDALNSNDTELNKTLYYHAIFASRYGIEYGVESEKATTLFMYGIIQYIVEGTIDEKTKGDKGLMKFKKTLIEEGHAELLNSVECLERGTKAFLNLDMKNPHVKENLKIFKKYLDNILSKKE